MDEETTFDDYDGAWKETIEKYFRPFLELCFPAVANQIDWTHAPEFMDKELQEVVRDARLGKRRVDKLVKVTALDGSQQIVFLHIEIQEQTEKEIGKRMFEYNRRIASRFDLPVVSLLFLTGQGWKKKAIDYRFDLWGCAIWFVYPVCYLEDFGGFEELAALTNPVGVVMAAHWAAQRTGKDDDNRLQAKKLLAFGLYAKCGGTEDFLELFRLVDWLLGMTEEKEFAFRQKVEEYEAEQNKDMAYITSVERYGRKIGEALGEARGEARGKILEKQVDILDALEVRFHRVPEGLKEAVEEIQEIPKLRDLLRHAILCQSVEHFAEKL